MDSRRNRRRKLLLVLNRNLEVELTNLTINPKDRVLNQGRNRKLDQLPDRRNWSVSRSRPKPSPRLDYFIRNPLVGLWDLVLNRKSNLLPRRR